MTKHTPGPWIAYQNKGQWAISREPGDESSKLVDQGHSFFVAYGGMPDSEANARLIAAAPELYEALKQFQLDIETHGHGPARQALLDQVATAIAKAEGGSQ